MAPTTITALAELRERAFEIVEDLTREHGLYGSAGEAIDTLQRIAAELGRLERTA